MKRILIIVLLIALITGCDDEPTIGTRAYAVVQTEVGEISSEGVYLSARILSRGEAEISQAGFIFGKGGSESYRMIVEEFGDSFDNFLQRDIAKGETFFVKAFVVSDNIVSYGNTVYFQSQGFDNPPPIVEQVSQMNVSDGARVLLTGKNFSLMPGINKIIVGGVFCEISFVGSDSLEFIIPTLAAGSKAAYLSTHGKQSGFGPINVKLPEIGSIEPIEGQPYSRVTIRGKYFGNRPVVYFGYIKAIMISFSDTLIVARVPFTQQEGEVNLVIDATGKKSDGGEKFTIISPAITGISTSTGKVGQRMVIYGKNFVNPEYGTRVFFDDREATILAPLDDSIEFYIPDITQANPLLRLIVGPHEVITSGFTKIDSWQKIGDFPGGPRNDPVALAVNSEGYAGLGSAANNSVMPDWWKFSPDTDNWTRLSDFPGAARYHTVSFAIDNKIYVGFGTAHHNRNTTDDNFFRDFWEYDIDSDQWSKITDPPMSVSEFYDLKNSSAIAYNGKGYIRLYDKMFVYDPSGGWSVLDIPPVALSGHYTYRPFCLEISGRIFWFFGFEYYYGSNTMLLVHEYNPQLNTLTHLITYNNPPVRALPVSIVLNNKGIFGGGPRANYLYPNERGSFLSFDPDTYELVRLESFHQPCASQAGFVIDGRGYIGLGATTGPVPGKEFFIFDPF